MKTAITTLLILLSGLSSSFAEEKTCEDKRKDMELFCRITVEQCEFIQSCLHRRDTCVDKQPKSEQECLRLNKCMDKIANRLPSRERCHYRWAETSTSSFCRVDPSWRFREEGCPGEVDTNILKLFAYGLKANVDSDFSCKASTALYKEKQESCLKARKAFSGCMNKEDKSDLKAYKESTPQVCEVYKNFHKTTRGSHFIAVEGIEEVTSNRGYQVEGESSSQSQSNRGQAVRGE